MNTKMKKLSLAVFQALSAGALMSLTATAVQAQQPQKVEKIEVTGSNISRAESETASPVQTITREDIEKSGKSSVAELLQTLAVDNQGSVPTTFGGGFAAGASGISLRGLGAASTLVLVNGRRIAPYGLADDGQKVFADLNLIPAEAVERIEVLKDGASAIYGSDAIAGVVNVILRKDFQGTTAKINYGQSRYHDGKDTRISLTHGFGDLGVNKYNVLLNFEYGNKEAIPYSRRSGRDQIGRSDLRYLGFDAQTGFSGVGIILDNNLAGSAINGNVRNPTTNDYYNRGNLAGVGFTRTFPGAACSNFSSSPQGDPLGGCIIDASQVYSHIQPKLKDYNFFGRGTLQISGNLQAYGEINFYKNESESRGTPSGVSGSTGFPGGPVSNAATALGAAHPDNPYFGSAARLRYLAADVGPRVSNVDSKFTRFVGGLKGTFAEWDYDTAVLYSRSEVSNSRAGYLQRDVMRGLLNPTAAQLVSGVAGLAPGTYWRIAENAGLNSAALYAALSPTISSDAYSQTTQVDLKASREIGQLPGGPAGLAVGIEARREELKLDPTTGTDRGNIIGLGYSAYEGKRSVTAAYAEVLAPVTKSIELSGAVRFDHYTDVGNSTTPKLGAKWTPVKQFVLRATYAEGFRAPSSAENGKGGLAAFSAAVDPLRCNLGVTSACSPGAVALITSPNPNLSPEKSKSYTLGFIFEPLQKTSVSVDLWQIVRKNEINQEQTAVAIAAGRVSRDPTTATAIAGDPGGITAVLTNYVNSAKSTVRGIDLDFSQRFDLSDGFGKLKFGARWTHLFKLLREEQDGSKFEFAGTHGNCDVTNCIGTPDNRVNVDATWEVGAWRVAGIVNYRGSIKNLHFKDEPDCANTFADGTFAPTGCKIKSFTTLDLTVLWKLNKHTELFGGVRNVFDSVAPLDPLTYGAVSYNPLDYSGAVGRYFSIGAKYKF